MLSQKLFDAASAVMQQRVNAPEITVGFFHKRVKKMVIDDGFLGRLADALFECAEIADSMERCKISRGAMHDPIDAPDLSRAMEIAKETERSLNDKKHYASLSTAAA